MNKKVFAARYKLQLLDPEILARQIEAERRWLEQRRNSNLGELDGADWKEQFDGKKVHE